MQEQTIFTEALEKEDPAERVAFLEAACAGDSRLRQRIERLLGQHDYAGSFLEQPIMSGEATAYHQTPISEQPGSVIGPYKLLQQIGEGGMGVVFMAEQTEPIQRTVALKIIKPGMDTRQVIARFEAERQAVALMDHPNIAKVLDAGTTDAGRPYFVMELVKGVPITKYCDDKLLPIRARLELFVEVCQAVQHAHQKGIIHRDIKPNNVLVAEYDNRAVPKVIDFGVAKATAQRLTERTMFTEFGQVLGTMEYMSPEQSKFNQLDIDTRSDIYSLGVLLYELLAGSTPFEGKRLHAAAFDEMLRIIREEEPQKPSTRLSSIDTLPSVAANRHTEPARLSKDVRGELDWIVMKALEKDRNRRYETASGFAADIERHLHDEPVEAGPPSTMYRFRKLIQRNKGAFLVTTAGAAVAALALVVLTLSNIRIIEETHQKDLALKEKEQALALAEAQSTRAQTNFLRANIAIRELMTKIATGGDDVPPAVRKRFADETIKYYQALLKDGSPDPTLRYETGVGYRMMAMLHESWKEYEQADKCFRQAIAVLGPLVVEQPANQQYRQQLGYAHLRYAKWLHFNQGKTRETREELRLGEELYEKLLAEAPESFDYAYELSDLLRLSMQSHISAGQVNDADKAYRRAAEVFERLIDGRFGPSPYPAGGQGRYLVQVFGNVQLEWASALASAGRLAEAEQIWRDAVKMIERERREHPGIANHWYILAAAHRDLGGIAVKQNRHEEAEVELRLAIEIYSDVIATRPNVVEAWVGRGRCYVTKREFEKAAEDFSAAIKLKPDSWEGWSGRARAHFELQQWEIAASDFSKAIDLGPEVNTNWLHRGHAYLQLAQWDKAAADFTTVVEEWPDDPGGWYSRALALAQLKQHSKAIADLRQAVAKGFKDVKKLKSDSWLNPLRSNDDFKKLLTELEKQEK